MSQPNLPDLQRCVADWHNRQPLARRLQAAQVHTLGWVALPFLRPTGDAPTQPALRMGWQNPLARWRGHDPRGPWPVFSEAFIEGLRPAQAARLARTHGLEAVPEGEHEVAAWPQRRIEVDNRLAERIADAWPTERWLLSAAIEADGQRRRVLLAPDGSRVIGPRLWRRGLLQALGLAGVAAVAALAFWLGGRDAETAAPPPARVARGSIGLAASSAPSAPMALSAPAISAASAPATSAASAPAAMAASAPDAAAASTASLPADAAASSVLAPTWQRPPDVPATLASAPLIDIRPQLLRERPPRPPLRGGGAASVPQAASAVAAPASARAEPPAAPARAQAPPEPARPELAPAPSRPSQPAASAPPGSVTALVGPGMKDRAQAEALLARMREHLGQSGMNNLQAELMQSPEGWRAVVYPFASREQAQLINATMVARGWRTRAINF